MNASVDGIYAFVYGSNKASTTTYGSIVSDGGEIEGPGVAASSL